MPWLTIIMWIISFLAAGGTKSGNAGKAALIATGAAAATYYAVDPANPDAVWDIFGKDAESATVSVPSTTAAVTGSTGTGIMDTAIRTAGGVLTSWGPTGTVGVVAGTAAATGSGAFSDLPDWVVPVGLAALAFVLLK